MCLFGEGVCLVPANALPSRERDRARNDVYRALVGGGVEVLVLKTNGVNSFFASVLDFRRRATIFSIGPRRLHFICGACHFAALRRVGRFRPRLIVGTIAMGCALSTFHGILPMLPGSYVVDSVTSMGAKLGGFCRRDNFQCMSDRPVFNPAFTDLDGLDDRGTVVVDRKSRLKGVFFGSLCRALQLGVFRCAFSRRSRAMTCSLSVPFISAFMFTTIVGRRRTPKAAFGGRVTVTGKLLDRSSCLLRRVLFGPHAPNRMAGVQARLGGLLRVVRGGSTRNVGGCLAGVQRGVGWSPTSVNGVWQSPTGGFFTKSFFVYAFMSTGASSRRGEGGSESDCREPSVKYNASCKYHFEFYRPTRTQYRLY